MSPASDWIDGLLEQVLEESASDLLLSSGQPGAMRVDGAWTELPRSEVTEEMLRGLLEPFMTGPRRASLEQTGSVDLTYVQRAENGRRARRFRVNLFRQTGGYSAAFRPIREEIPTFAQLNLPDAVRTLADAPHGLVLVTGAAGSGKSTTLAAVLEHLNRTRAKHVITLEDPIEYLYQRRRCIVHQREIGIHVESFASGLRAALREAPDIILVGEMRDRETIAAALTAAETGHLVLSTLHTGSAPMAIERIVDVFPADQQTQVRTQLASVLRTVLTQRLLPSSRPGLRVPVVELMHVNHAVASLIRDGRVHQLLNVIQTSREEGMITLERSLVELVRTGRISREAAQRATADQTQLEEWLKQRG